MTSISNHAGTVPYTFLVTVRVLVTHLNYVAAFPHNQREEITLYGKSSQFSWVSVRYAIRTARIKLGRQRTVCGKHLSGEI